MFYIIGCFVRKKNFLKLFEIKTQKMINLLNELKSMTLSIVRLKMSSFSGITIIVEIMRYFKILELK